MYVPAGHAPEQGAQVLSAVAVQGVVLKLPAGHALEHEVQTMLEVAVQADTM